MEFFNAFILSITSFFGIVAEPEPASSSEPAPLVQEVAEEGTSNGGATMSDGDAGVASPASTTVVSEVESTQSVADNSIAPQELSDSATGGEMTGDTPVVEPVNNSADSETMMAAGGCFWCVEADLEKLPGVIDVVSGYSGGTTANPSYGNYGAGGHREVVQVTYDPAVVSFEDILIVTLKTTDPTDDDGTFGDRGDKYSAAFYYENESQRNIIESLIAEVNEFGPYDEPLAIDVEERAPFWPAEDRHQDYYKGTLTQLRYGYYRTASGRDDFIAEHWGTNVGPELPWRDNENVNSNSMNDTMYPWENYQKPEKSVLEDRLDALAFRVTQEDGTERAGTSPLDKVYEDGIYVDILSGEPLFSSRDKYDSGTGWPSFTRPITPEAVTEHADNSWFSRRTEIRSAIADNHLGHVFSDGPAESTGLRYCMNGVALEFVPRAEMETRGYGDFLQYL